jgi:hypothetical protein
MSFAKNGATVSGIYDSGAEVCVLSTRVALEMGLLPWDGERDARAANGESMIVHGVANSVETYHDGARLMIDFLITDLDGEFDFLLGWNAIQHYGLAVDSQTGQLKGTDYDGHKFVTKSQFAYTSLVSAMMAGPGEEFSDAAQAALKSGVTAQLNHLQSAEHAEQLAEHTDGCEAKYFGAVRQAHEALHQSAHPAVQHVMQNEWKDDTTFMEQVHPADSVWKHDSSLQKAQSELCETRAQLVAALSLQQQCQTTQVLPASSNAPRQTLGAEYQAAAVEVATRMGQVTQQAATQCFNWARRALKATANALGQ